MRAEFPNPDHKLLPGLFARVRGTSGRLENALVVPDRAVQEQLGRYFLTVVGEGDKAELRPVELGPRFGNRQVINVGPRRRRSRRRRGPAEGPARDAAQGDPGDARGLRPAAAGGRPPPRPPPRGELGGASAVARFFIDRPVFAIVVSLFLLLIGTLSLIQLPVGEFPNIALPTVQVNANYLGASSDIVEESVTAPIDQQVNGATDMLYINSVSGDDGSASIAVTFALERDPDLAAVEVQNRVSQANSQLPAEVINAGVTVRKQSPDTLMYLALYSPDGTYDPLFISNYGFVYVVDELKRVKGVGDVRVFGSDFGMRVWLKPDRMASLGITAADVAAGDPRAEPAGAGRPGRPAAGHARAELPVLAARAGPAHRGGGIRRRHRAARSRTARSSASGTSAASNSARAATATSRRSTASRPPRSRSRWCRARTRSRPRTSSRRELARARGAFPKGLDYRIVYDTSAFVEASVEEVVKTFFEALLLVLIVVFLFLQNWRTTLIPMLAVPVSLIATFAAFQLLGFSINTLSLFGMVLAIGIVVDDAIVVVEAVEHNMQPGTRRRATRRSRRWTRCRARSSRSR